MKRPQIRTATDFLKQMVRCPKRRMYGPYNRAFQLEGVVIEVFSYNMSKSMQIHTRFDRYVWIGADEPLQVLDSFGELIPFD